MPQQYEPPGGMRKQPKRQKAAPTEVVIIYDNTFGLGPSFPLTKAELTDKTVKINGSKRRRSSLTFAIATKKLLQEANEIRDEMKKIEARAREFREKLQQLQPPIQ